MLVYRLLLILGLIQLMGLTLDGIILLLKMDRRFAFKLLLQSFQGSQLVIENLGSLSQDTTLIWKTAYSQKWSFKILQDYSRPINGNLLTNSRQQLLRFHSNFYRNLLDNSKGRKWVLVKSRFLNLWGRWKADGLSLSLGRENNCIVLTKTFRFDWLIISFRWIQILTIDKICTIERKWTILVLKVKKKGWRTFREETGSWERNTMGRVLIDFYYHWLISSYDAQNI